MCTISLMACGSFICDKLTNSTDKTFGELFWNFFWSFLELFWIFFYLFCNYLAYLAYLAYLTLTVEALITILTIENLNDSICFLKIKRYTGKHLQFLRCVYLSEYLN